MTRHTRPGDPQDYYRRLAAEFVGTGLLVIGGVGTAVLAPKVGQLGIAFAFGLTLLTLAYALGPISGCHVNPAVTLGLTVAGRLTLRDAAGYVIAQLTGGIAGAGVVYGIAANCDGYQLHRDGLGANGWGTHSTGGYGLPAAVIAELVLTALLVFTILAVTTTDSEAAVAGIPIGIALVVAHLLAIPIDGTSVNPARSLGPALIVGGSALSQLWLFLIIPPIGGLLGAGLHQLLKPTTRDPQTHNDQQGEPTADPEQQPS